LDVHKFSPIKAHKRVLNRFQRYLQYGNCAAPETQNHQENPSKLPLNPLPSHQMQQLGDQFFRALLKGVESSEHQELVNKHLPQISFELSKCKKKHIQANFSTNICMKFLKFTNDKRLIVTLANMLIEHLPASFQATVSGNGFINFILPATTIPESTPRVPNHQSPQPNVPQHKLEVSSLWEILSSKKYSPEVFCTWKITLEDATFTTEKYELYRRYQIAIHNSAEGSSEVQPSGFSDFLCSSPLIVSLQFIEKSRNRGIFY
jgi:arginyl-tRNA--protein-N-Asp/Glu arginylyltransferase